MQVWSLHQEDALEEGMATHSSTIAWRIPLTGEPGRVQSIESQRVRHSLTDSAYTQSYMLAYKYVYMCLHIYIYIYIYNEKYNDNLYLSQYRYRYSFPGGAVVKNPPANAEGATDVSSIPRLERFPGVGNGNLL